MKIELCNDKKEFDLEIIIVKSLKTFNEDTNKIFKDYCFEAKEDSCLLLIDTNKLYVGTNKLKGEDLKIAVSNAIRELKKYKFKKIKISLVQNDKEFLI